MKGTDSPAHAKRLESSVIRCRSLSLGLASISNGLMWPWTQAPFSYRKQVTIMAREKFWIRTNNGPKEVEGYKEPFLDYAGRETFVGVFKADNGQWHVSCLRTGYMLNAAPTKKEAIAKFHEIYEAKYNKLLKEEYDEKSYISRMSKEFNGMTISVERADNER